MASTSISGSDSSGSQSIPSPASPSILVPLSDPAIPTLSSTVPLPGVVSTLRGNLSSSSQPSSKSSSSLNSIGKFPINRSHLQAAPSISEEIAGSREEYNAVVSKLQKASLSDDMLSSFKREFGLLFSVSKVLFVLLVLCATGLLASHFLAGMLGHSASHVRFAFWNEVRASAFYQLGNSGLSAVVFAFPDH